MKTFVIAALVICSATPSHAFQYMWTTDNTPACIEAKKRLTEADEQKTPESVMRKLDNNELCACGVLRGDNGKPAGKCRGKR